MKTISMKTLAAGIVAGVMLFTSCKGPIGPTGYTGTVGSPGTQGPQGIAGTNGTNGTNGANGTNGTNGANSVTTYTMLSNTATWTWDPVQLQTSATYTISPTILTQGIVDSGAVMLYEQASSGGWWRAMPYIVSTGFSSHGNPVNEQVRWDFVSGSILVIESYSNDSMITGSIGNLKLVCISASARRANPNLDLHNFEAVKNAYHIK